MAKNYHKTLGISSSASKSEIKRAYRRLAMKYHPDKNSSEQAQKLFIEINEAYAFLSNEKISVLNTQQKNYNDSSKKNFSKEELEKRIRWAKQYAKYKKIKEEKINEISYHKIQNSSLGWIASLISSISITLAIIIFLDFKILPPLSFKVDLLTNYIDMGSQKLALKLRDNKQNEFTFGVSFDDIKRVNIASINEYSCQKSRLLRQNTNMILKINDQEVSIFNHYCVYKVFYFYLVILLLPLITLISKGPNSVYILSTYIITSVSVMGMIFLLLTILI